MKTFSFGGGALCGMVGVKFPTRVEPVPPAEEARRS